MNLIIGVIRETILKNEKEIKEIDDALYNYTVKKHRLQESVDTLKEQMNQLEVMLKMADANANAMGPAQFMKNPEGGVRLNQNENRY